MMARAPQKGDCVGTVVQATTRGRCTPASRGYGQARVCGLRLFVVVFFLSKPTEINGSNWLLKKWRQTEDAFRCVVIMQQQRTWGNEGLDEITPTLMQCSVT